MTVITRATVVEKLAAHLQHELSLDSLVAWAESALMDGEFDPAHLPTIRDVVARIGVAAVRAFGLTWENCGAHGRQPCSRVVLRRHLAEAWPRAEAGEQLLTQLGYSAQVSIVAR